MKRRKYLVLFETYKPLSGINIGPQQKTAVLLVIISLVKRLDGNRFRTLEALYRCGEGPGFCYGA